MRWWQVCWWKYAFNCLCLLFDGCSGGTAMLEMSDMLVPVTHRKISPATAAIVVLSQSRVKWRRQHFSSVFLVFRLSNFNCCCCWPPPRRILGQEKNCTQFHYQWHGSQAQQLTADGPYYLRCERFDSLVATSTFFHPSHRLELLLLFIIATSRVRFRRSRSVDDECTIFHWCNYSSFSPIL